MGKRMRFTNLPARVRILKTEPERHGRSIHLLLDACAACNVFYVHKAATRQYENSFRAQQVHCKK